MKKYKARFGWMMSIEVVEVLGETKDFITLPNGRREAKATEWYGYFDTAGQAKGELVKRSDKKFLDLCRNIDNALKECDKAKSIDISMWEE